MRGNMKRDLPSMKLGLLHARRSSLRALAITVAVFALLAAVGAKQASATMTTQVDIYNESNSDLNFLAITNYGSQGPWNDQQWATTYPIATGGDPNPPSCFVPGGPGADIPANGHVCFVATSTGSQTNGTGGAMSYNINLPYIVDENKDSPTYMQMIPNPYTATVAFAWTSPSLSGNGVGGILGTYSDANTPINTCTQGNASNNFQQICTHAGNEIYGAALNFESEAWSSDSGDMAAFTLSQTAASDINITNASGYMYQEVTLNGSNFDTTGETQVFFSGVPALSVTCPTSSQCFAEAPEEFVIYPIPALVTVNIFGATTNAGTFTYLPPGPACTYSVATSATTGNGFINADCAGDSLADPVTIYLLNNDGEWSPVYNYTGSNELEFIDGGGPGTEYQFEACLTANGLPITPSAVPTTPGGVGVGCDHPFTVSIPPLFHLGPIQIGHLE
jgi:hypothetical protein